ncbi:MAG: PaaI family thioesterase [Cryomorphaceae bacterium]
MPPAISAVKTRLPDIDMNEILKKYDEVNNFGKNLGLELEVLRPGKVIYRMTISKMHLSNPFAAHGGAISGMMDGILGVSALSLAVESNKLVSTVEYKLNYFKPIEKGDKLRGVGEVIFEGNRLLTCEGKIYADNKDGMLVCSGIGTFNAYPAAKNQLFSEYSG